MGNIIPFPTRKRKPVRRTNTFKSILQKRFGDAGNAISRVRTVEDLLQLLDSSDFDLDYEDLRDIEELLLVEDLLPLDED